jgi:hypothetical protein
MKSLKELCGAHGVDRLPQIEAALVEDHRADMPWYLRIIVGIGAWLAAIFFFGFALQLLGWQEEHRTSFGIIGVGCLAVAAFLGRQKLGVFIGQCMLAVSFAAQVMIYYGFVNEHFHPLATAMVFSIVLAAILYIAFPNFLSRIATCLVALQLTLLWIYTGDGEPFSGLLRDESNLFPFLLFYWAFHLAAICWCFLRPRGSIFLAPLGYALVASLAAWQTESLLNVWSRSTEIGLAVPIMEFFGTYFQGVLTALTLFGVAVWSVGGLSALRERIPLFTGLAVALATLVWLGSGGMLLAMLFLLIGFALQNRPVLGIGLISFPVFLTYYYYNLHLDLLAKSGVLIGSGIVLLALRSVLKRWAFAHPEKAV